MPHRRKKRGRGHSPAIDPISDEKKDSKDQMEEKEDSKDQMEEKEDSKDQMEEKEDSKDQMGTEPEEKEDSKNRMGTEPEEKEDSKNQMGTEPKDEHHAFLAHFGLSGLGPFVREDETWLGWQLAIYRGHDYASKHPIRYSKQLAEAKRLGLFPLVSCRFEPVMGVELEMHRAVGRSAFQSLQIAGFVRPLQELVLDFAHPLMKVSEVELPSVGREVVFMDKEAYRVLDMVVKGHHDDYGFVWVWDGEREETSILTGCWRLFTRVKHPSIHS